jgi:4-hydroxy-3-methylbut-2-enyl diphosphate reductase
MDPPSDDICYATQNRQAAVKNIAPKVDVLIVVGSSNSSNSVRLVDVALEAGVKKSFRVDSESELKKEWFEGAKSVGLTSGASVPEELGDVEEVETIEEHITFSLPVEIRKDLKAAGKA